MNATTRSPNPAHEHFAELSAVPVEALSAELESRLRARYGAPTGFHLNLTAGDIKDMLANPDWSGEWDGPTIQLDGSKITTGWNPETGIYFFVDHEDDNPWPIREAATLSAAIESLATKLAPNYAASVFVRTAPTTPTIQPIVCEIWCQDGDGHPEESLAEDQHCWSVGKLVPLATYNAQAPADEPDILELYMHRPDETRELVVGINPDRVHTRSLEFTKAEWDLFVQAGNELWAAAK